MTLQPLRIPLAALAIGGSVVCCGGARDAPPRIAGTTTTTSAPFDKEPAESPTAPAPAAVPPADVRHSAALPILAPPTYAATTTRGDRSPTVVYAVNDAQISAVLDAMATTDVDLARIARTRARSPRVKELADAMIADDDRAASSLRTLDMKDGITPEEGPLSDQVKLRSEQTMLTLRSGILTDVDRPYLDDAIDRSQNALDAIDRFVLQAQSTALRNHLQECRRKIADHLRDAKTVKALLGI